MAANSPAPWGKSSSRCSATPIRTSTFVTHEEIKPERYYATYSIGLFFDDKDCVHQPCDFRHVGLHRTAGYILGVDPTEVPPRIVLADDTRPIAEPYVCIAVQSTTQSKYWNNPNGWREIVAFLKDAGYRVVCIDQKPAHGHGLVWNHIPHGAEDETGDRPLAERARWLRHAEFFVGLSSGLSWLAWAAGTPVVMIIRLHPSDQRIRDALSGDQLSRLQHLLERRAPPLRPQGFPVVPAPQGHAAPVRMHAADHGRSGEGGDPDGAGIWRRCRSATRYAPATGAASAVRRRRTALFQRRLGKGVEFLRRYRLRQKRRRLPHGQADRLD